MISSFTIVDKAAHNSCRREEYNGLKTTITSRQSPTAFSELHALLSDHDYMLGKTRAPAPSITLCFAANYAVGSLSMLEAHQAQLLKLTTQLSALGFQVSSIASSGLQAFYGARPSNNNRNNNTYNCGNRNNSYGNNNQGRVSHLSPTSQNSPKSSNGQPSFVSTTSIPTPPPPFITQQRTVNLRQNPKQRVSYNLSANYAIVLPTTITEPTSFTVSNNSPKWRQAIKEEYDALMKNGTCSLVPLASNTNVVDVVKSITIRAVLSFVVTNNRPLRQLDVHNAFLYGNLKEQAYMKQLPGFIDPQQPNHVCLLHKSLYGLKHALHAWFERLSKALFDLSFIGSKTAPSLFIYSCGHTLCTLCYMPLNYFLGIEIVPHVSGILASQKKYILELLQSADLSNYNHVSSPMITLSSLSLDDSIAFSNLVKYQQSAIKRILRYLHGTVEHGMLIHRSSGSTLEAFTDVLWKGNPDTSFKSFSDADWAGVSDDQRSTGRFSLYLGSNHISWTSRKQRTVLRSSTKVEYKALANIVVELTWLQALLHELGIRSSSTPILYSAIFTAVASPFFWQWELSSLAVETSPGIGNSITGSRNALCILFPTILP
uniref:Reverse transcriptase Ty1/copia-type domain-containing protein n=1 Tax=Tanacetum cinerariifolium TaxID=118510 RepID=A0A6L2J0K5_TANCI|nr:hypothetical protein [Tanacetum cinerariifolium]